MTAPRAPSFDDILAARERLKGYVRTTPVIEWTSAAGIRVHLKLEQLQVGGSFKARGAFNRLLSTPASELEAGVVTASGGNHGLGVAVAAKRTGAPATVFLPASAPRSTEQRLLRLGAKVVRGGASWDDAWALAVEHSEKQGGLLVHPFEDPLVVAGQGTIGLELVEQVPSLDLAIVAIGGGGLISGVGVALKARKPAVRLVGVEPTGADSMKQSVAAGRIVTLDRVTTIAGTLAPRAPGPLTLSLSQKHVDEIVLVEDREMLEAVSLLWEEVRLLVEPAGAAALAALTTGRVAPRDARSVAVLLCGANLDEELAFRAIRGAL
ncbi:threonine/serine dehydratase [bacterium]|nr:threonine/serine dehydratase [bacterium]